MILPCSVAFRSSLSRFSLTVLVVLIAACFDHGHSASSDHEPMALTSELSVAVIETSQLAIYDAVIPQPASDTAALYFTIVDRDGEGDRLLSVTSPVASIAHLHSVVVENGRSLMNPVEDGITLSPSGIRKLVPGSFHVMLMGLKKDLVVDEMVDVRLEFERAGTLMIQVPVVTYLHLH